MAQGNGITNHCKQPFSPEPKLTHTPAWLWSANKQLGHFTYVGVLQQWPLSVSIRSPGFEYFISPSLKIAPSFHILSAYGPLHQQMAHVLMHRPTSYQRPLFLNLEKNSSCSPLQCKNQCHQLKAKYWSWVPSCCRLGVYFCCNDIIPSLVK